MRPGATRVALPVFAALVFALSLIGAERSNASWPLGGTRIGSNWTIDSLRWLYASPLLAVPDAAHGAFVVWSGEDDFDRVIAGQRVLEDGTIAPGWPESGLTLYAVGGFKPLPVSACAGSPGSAFVAGATLFTNGHITMPVMHVSGAGAVLVHLLSSGSQTDADAPFTILDMGQDGGGGAILAWVQQDLNPDPPNQRVLAQRFTSVFTRAWGPAGIALTDPLPLGVVVRTLAIASDEAGTAIVVWSTSDGVIRAQRIDSTATSHWSVGGVEVGGTATRRLRAVSDGARGAIIVWSTTGGDILAQRVDSTGTSLWGPSGIPICAAIGAQTDPRIVADGNGGALITWMDSRGFVSVQRVNGDATFPSGWPANGVVASAAAQAIEPPALASDQDGGALLAWVDDHDGNHDIFAQYVSAAGSPRYGTPGRDWFELCNEGHAQSNVTMTPDGSGGAIAAWRDTRDLAIDLHVSVYAQAIARPSPPSGVGDGVASGLALRAPAPNPSHGPMTIAFSLPSSGRARLEMMDLQGRRVREWSWSSPAPGRHAVDVSGTSALPAGLYVIRLAQDGHVRTARAVVIR